MDRAAGGMPEVNRVELRFCPVCSRPLIGHEAANRRKLDESGPEGRKLPCGANCEREAASGIWRRLIGERYRKDKAA